MRWVFKVILYGPFLWMGFNCLKVTYSHFEEAVYFLEIQNSVPRNSWYSFYQPRNDERLSRPWSHPVVLNTGPLDWESSALTTRPLAIQSICYQIVSPDIIFLPPDNGFPNTRWYAPMLLWYRNYSIYFQCLSFD